MITNDNNLPMLFNSQDEVDFLLNSLRPDHTVLEWGTGASTIEIAKRVKKIYAIEHDHRWFTKVKEEITVEGLDQKVTLVHIPKNSEEAQGHDGTFNNYLDYVEYPICLHVKFDIVLIDGRTRAYCAKVAAELLKPNGLIFIHDYKHPQEKYRRHEYEVVETFLEVVEGVFALYKFKKKS